MEDKLILGYDCSDNDIPTLTVSRNIGDKIINRNVLQGDVAMGIYHLLTGGATLKFNEIPDNVLFKLKCIKEHLQYVFQSIDKSVDFDIKMIDECISTIEQKQQEEIKKYEF